MSANGPRYGHADPTRRHWSCEVLGGVPGATELCKLRREQEFASGQVSVPRAASMRFIWSSPIMPFTMLWKRGWPAPEKMYCQR